MVMRTLFVTLCAGLGMVACGGSPDPTATSTGNLKGGSSAQHASDASEGNEDTDHDGGMANGIGNGQGAQNGQGTGDGKDCKPADGGPSPCAQGQGLDDTSDDDASDNDDADKDCKPLDGGPSPCAQGKSRDH